MKTVLLCILLLMSSLPGSAREEDGPSLLPITPGTVFETGTPFGSFSDVVLAVIGDQALITHFDRIEWRSVAELREAVNKSWVSIYSPLPSPYKYVLVPVYGNLYQRQITQYKAIAVAYYFKGFWGREYVLDAYGNKYGIGKHLARGLGEGILNYIQVNIAVKNDETVPQAIAAYNEQNKNVLGFETIPTNIFINYSRVESKPDIREMIAAADRHAVEKKAKAGLRAQKLSCESEMTGKP